MVIEEVKMKCGVSMKPVAVREDLLWLIRLLLQNCYDICKLA